MKSSPDMGMSIPNTVGQIGHEMPPKSLSKVDTTGGFCKKKKCCTIQFYKIWVISSVGWHTVHLKIQAKEQDEAFHALAKLAELALSYFLENFMNPVSCIFPYLEKY